MGGRGTLEGLGMEMEFCNDGTIADYIERQLTLEPREHLDEWLVSLFIYQIK